MYQNNELYFNIKNNLDNTTRSVLLKRLETDFNEKILIPYADTDMKTELNTKVENQTNNIDVLSRGTSLYNTDNTFKVYISNEGELTISYKEKIDDEIDNNIKYGTKDKTAYMYSITKEKHRVGDYFTKRRGYVGYDGMFYETPGSDEDNDYEEYQSNFCFRMPSDGVQNDSNSSYGYFQETGDSDKKNYINENTKSFLYKSDSCNPGDIPGKYFHKKYSLGSEYSHCVQNAEKTKMITYAEYEDLEKVSGTMSSDKCGFNFLLKKERSEMDQSRDKLEEDLTAALTAFKELSKDELETLNDIKVNRNEINELVQDYNELHEKSKKHKEKKALIHSQMKDRKIVYHSMQYKTALIGIATVATTVALFSIMKK